MDLSYFRMWASLFISFQWKGFVTEEASAEFSATSSSQAYWFQFSNIILPVSIMMGKMWQQIEVIIFQSSPVVTMLTFLHETSQLEGVFGVDL